MEREEKISVGQTLKENVGRKKKIQGRLLTVIVVVIFSGLVVFTGLRKHNAETTSYQTTVVHRGDLEITVTATGNLEATNQVDVGSELSGIVTKVLVDYNDTVALNQPLAYLDDTKFKAAVDKSRAQVASAEAGYEEAIATREAAGKTLARYRKTRELTGGKFPSLEVLEQAEAAHAKARAAASSAEASIEVARASLQADTIDLNKAIIYSPTDGIVLVRDVDKGQTVAASLQAPVLFTIAEDLSNMELQVDVDEADVGLVGEGQRARFTVDAYPESSFDARVTQVRYGAETTDGVVTYSTMLEVANPQLLLRPGMTATATIVVKRIENSLLVPNTALRFTPSSEVKMTNKKRSFLGSLMPAPPRRMARVQKELAGDGSAGARVWVVGGDGRPMALQVKKGATDGVMTAVSSENLEEGVRVITNEYTTVG